MPERMQRLHRGTHDVLGEHPGRPGKLVRLFLRRHSFARELGRHLTDTLLLHVVMVTQYKNPVLWTDPFDCTIRKIDAGGLGTVGKQRASHW